MRVITADAAPQHHVFLAAEEILVLWASDIGLVALPRKMCYFAMCLFILLMFGSMHPSMARLTGAHTLRKTLVYIHVNMTHMGTVGPHEGVLPGQYGQSNLAEALHLQLQIRPAKKNCC